MHMKSSVDSGKNERRDSVFVFEDEKPGGRGGDTAKPNTNAVNQFLVELMFFFGKAFFYLFPVYLAGFLGLSISWVFLGLFFWMWWKKNRKGKLARLSSAFEMLESEKYIIAKEIYEHMPAWINFPDIERVEWLNKILQQAWPFFGSYMDKLLRETVEPSVRGCSVHLKTFTFTKIDFGEKCFRINGVKAYTKEVDKRQVILDLQISYAGDCEINIDVQKVCKAGLKGVQLHGTLRVILEPLIRDVPLVGAITAFFIRKPVLEISWTGLTNLLDVPGLSGISDTMILDIITSYMVLPNRFTVPLIKDVSVAQLRFPIPRGVVRVYLLEAENLIIKDTYFGGIVKGKSDPYGLLRVGTQNFRSKTIKENLNPKWNETYEFIVHEAPGQDLEVDLYDEDPDKDDFLGSIVIDLGEVMKDRVVDEWFPLNDVKSGKVHLKLEWLSLTTNKENLNEISKNQSSAVLIIYLDSACNLPTTNLEYANCEYASKKKNPKYIKLTKKAKGEPNAYVQLSVGEKNQKSKMRYTSKDPVWEEAFTFFIRNAHSQTLHAEIKDDNRDCALGMLDIPLYRILQATDMTLDQRFHLEHSGSNSFIKMKIVLRILRIEEPDPNSVYSGLSALKKGPVSIKAKKKGFRDESSPKVHKKSSSGTQQSDANGNKTESNSIRKVSAPIGEKDSEPKTPGTPFTKAQNRHLFRKDVTSSSSAISLASSTETLDRDHPLPNGSSLDGVTLGEIQITVRYASLRNCLVVIIGGCRNLIPCSNEGADPYVRIYLLPSKSWSTRKKTSVKKKTLNPQFDEKFEFQISLEEAKNRKLDIAVKNNKSFTSHERKELGKVLLDLSADNLTSGFTQWYELTMDGNTEANH